MNNKKKRDRAVIDGEPNPDMERREMPHIAIVTLKLDVRAIFPNGLFDKYVMGDEALRKYGLAQKGQFVMKGYSEGDCLQKVQKLLEDINGKARE